MAWDNSSFFVLVSPTGIVITETARITYDDACDEAFIFLFNDSTKKWPKRFWWNQRDAFIAARVKRGWRIHGSELITNTNPVKQENNTEVEDENNLR